MIYRNKGIGWVAYLEYWKYGSTQRAHLHYEIRIDGSPVDIVALSHGIQPYHSRYGNIGAKILG
ncbi:hypothetical protein J2TS6_09670 [Paenibacillus albilobatus]|uniref:Uncharacterized protein n=1 Tax=Paenibacillus albilobatus TaxID=2716884 RepID=A0A919XBX2_9BACL|nr:hypothetical protein J2TS6_09670 [Paenibacillus albilobatus]